MYIYFFYFFFQTVSAGACSALTGSPRNRPDGQAHEHGRVHSPAIFEGSVANSVERPRLCCNNSVNEPGCSMFHDQTAPGAVQMPALRTRDHCLWICCK